MRGGYRGKYTRGSKNMAACDKHLQEMGWQCIENTGRRVVYKRLFGDSAVNAVYTIMIWRGAEWERKSDFGFAQLSGPKYKWNSRDCLENDFIFKRWNTAAGVIDYGHKTAVEAFEQFKEKRSFVLIEDFTEHAARNQKRK